jgi:hypothetical protein
MGSNPVKEFEIVGSFMADAGMNKATQIVNAAAACSGAPG